MAKTKHDNAFYLRLLCKRQPAVFARYEAGEFTSVARALIEGGIRSAPKPIHALERAWKNASESEQAVFLASIGAKVGKAATIASAPSPGPPIADHDLRLTEMTIARIKTLYPADRFPCGEIMRAIGFGARDASLGSAMTRKSRISQKMADALTIWLPEEEASR